MMDGRVLCTREGPPISGDTQERPRLLPPHLPFLYRRTSGCFQFGAIANKTGKNIHVRGSVCMSESPGLNTRVQVWDFVRNCLFFSVVLCIPVSNACGTVFSPSSPASGVDTICYFSHSDRCVAVSVIFF